jgi:hypothetical protein
MVWLVPLVKAVTLQVLLHQALDFTHGHFADWGGSLLTVSDPAVRLAHLLWGIFPYGLGLWWIDLPYMQLLPSFCLISGLYLFLRDNKHIMQRRFVLITLLPYLLWVFLAQNVEKPRHVLPLIPLLLVGTSAGLLGNRHPGLRLSGLLIISVIISGTYSLRLAQDYSQSRPPLMQLVNYVTSAPNGFDQLSTRIYCGETRRLFDYYAPGWDARRVRNLEGMRYDYRASLCPPPNLLVTSEVAGATCNVPLNKFKGNRYIYAPYHEIALFEMDGHGL